MITDEVSINGTLIWYYYICKREVWLMSRYIVPDQENANIDLGRFIHDEAYERQKKEINLGNIVLDIFRKEKGQLIIGEVKKTSRYEKSAMMQLAFYLKELKEHGVNASGELLFPKERKKLKLN